MRKLTLEQLKSQIHPTKTYTFSPQCTHKHTLYYFHENRGRVLYIKISYKCILYLPTYLPENCMYVKLNVVCANGRNRIPKKQGFRRLLHIGGVFRIRIQDKCFRKNFFLLTFCYSCYFVRVKKINV